MIIGILMRQHHRSLSYLGTSFLNTSRFSNQSRRCKVILRINIFWSKVFLCTVPIFFWEECMKEGKKRLPVHAKDNLANNQNHHIKLILFFPINLCICIHLVPIEKKGCVHCTVWGQSALSTLFRLTLKLCCWWGTVERGRLAAIITIDEGLVIWSGSGHMTHIPRVDLDLIAPVWRTSHCIGEGDSNHPL